MLVIRIPIHEAVTKFLSNYHDVNISIRTLKWCLSDHGLKKKDRTLSNDVISQVNQREIQGPHVTRGYRGIWSYLKHIIMLVLQGTLT